ncbi:MAG: hypothetical protein HC882_08950 [Acidobacteria bacterium]|nr:hypothetical protein [Acidobacteriota bacterium]
MYEGCVAPAWELLEPFAADAPGALPIACAEVDGYPDNEAPLLPILRFLSAVPTPDAALIAAVQRLSDRLLRQDPLAEYETTQRALVLVRGWGG